MLHPGVMVNILHFLHLLLATVPHIFRRKYSFSAVYDLMDFCCFVLMSCVLWNDCHSLVCDLLSLCILFSVRSLSKPDLRDLLDH